MKYCFVLIGIILFCGCQENRAPVKESYPMQGLATWYIPHVTATGEVYHKNEFTCAMRKRGFGKYYLACNVENNKCVRVRQNDFGPADYLFREGRIIDLSEYAFSKIADLHKGVIQVRIGEVYAGPTD